MATPLLAKARARSFASAESGSVAVEYAFVLPVFVFMVFLCMQCTWLLFEVSSFDSAVSSSLTYIDPHQVEQAKRQGQDLDQLMKDTIERNGVLIDMNQVGVSGMNAGFPDYYQQKDLSQSDKDDYSIRRITQERRYMKLSGTVEYTVKLLFPLPGLSDMKITKSIDESKLADTTFEVS